MFPITFPFQRIAKDMPEVENADCRFEIGVLERHRAWRIGHREIKLAADSRQT
jgi:hypothetical protein